MGQLKVTVDTRGRAGPLLRTATIYSNDQVTPARSVSVTLDVVEK